MPASTSSKTVKMSIILDANGHVVGASKPRDYQPAKAGDEPVVTVAVAAGVGQSMAEVEVPADLADLDATKLLPRLAEQTSVRAVIANLPPTAGGAPTAGAAPLAGVASAASGAATRSSHGLLTPGVTAGSI